MYQRIKEAALEKPHYAAIYYQGKKISYKKFLAMIDRGLQQIAAGQGRLVTTEELEHMLNE